jgi:hypothetical protein
MEMAAMSINSMETEKKKMAAFPPLSAAFHLSHKGEEGQLLRAYCSYVKEPVETTFPDASANPSRRRPKMEAPAPTPLAEATA